MKWLHTEQHPVLELSLLGGKAANLLTLGNNGISVPSWCCIHVKAFEHVFDSLRSAIEDQLSHVDYQDRSSIEEAADKIKTLFVEVSVPQGLKGELKNALAVGDGFWAVRSSALSEDSLHASFAGQLDTSLYVPTTQVLAHIQQAWASGFSARVLSYQFLKGLNPLDMRVAVIVQQMVPAKAAGVMFMANPQSSITEVAISAAFGLGEGVVSDAVVSDNYIYNRLTKELTVHVALKDKQVLFDEARQRDTVHQKLADKLKTRRVLSENQIHELLAIGERIGSIYDHYQDIEWALDENGFHILQTRPITTIPKGAHTIFDNSNIVESYPYLTKPLTFSFIKHAYEIIIRQALLYIGLSPQKVFEHNTITKNLLGYLDGRVYYNLSNWYDMMGLIPGLESYTRVWEKMLGVQQHGDLRQKSLLRNLPQLSRVVGNLAVTAVKLDKQMRLFHANFARVHDKYNNLNYGRMSNHELCTAYDNLASELLYDWHITLINDIYCFVFTQLAQSYLEYCGCVDSQKLLNDLLRGECDLPSLQPLHSIVSLAESVRGDPRLELHIKTISQANDTQAGRLLEELLDDHKHIHFSCAYRQHLERFAERTVFELKLESKTLRQKPQELCRLIQQYVPLKMTVAGLREHELRDFQQAQQSISSIFHRRPLQAAVFKSLLKLARRSVVYRESSRIERARAYDLPRRIFTAIANNFCAEGVLDGPNDIFMLTVDEIMGFIQGTSVNDELRCIVEMRKQQHSVHGMSCPQDRIHTSGNVHGNYIPQKQKQGTEQQADNGLVGTGCCSGRVTAEAIIVEDPTAIDAPVDKILVAPMTDPGWIFVMAQAKGLIVEKGSMLSHTAIVGRELGIPTIVGVSGATTKIRTGQWITMDGSSGRITKIEHY